VMLKSSESERSRLDNVLTPEINQVDRARMWSSVDAILRSYDSNSRACTLALGYVQSGKTTSMAALTAAAADEGFEVVIAFLGTKLLLLDQNRQRIETMLGMDQALYKWIVLPGIKGRSEKSEIEEQLERGRTLFIPVLKHSRQIEKVVAAIAAVDRKLKVLIIDDEADQASLNTRPSTDIPSSTYQAICDLRDVCPNHLYVQYTATPYAPLLLPPHDPLMPTAVEFLVPGSGYTGGREFFITNADKVIRSIPLTDEGSKNQIEKLPRSLLTALASFVAGAAVLLTQEGVAAAPISMLIHPTHRNDAQAKYNFLLKRFMHQIRNLENLANSEFGQLIKGEYARLVANGVDPVREPDFWEQAASVIVESTISLVNSETDINRVQWNQSPCHILIGGNKLDRGFTVEGLTVSYLNRKASEQIDTLEQRTRAYGYRSKYLPFCQLFASPRTIRVLRGIVHTEDDLRANLRDHLESGGTVDNWAQEIGLDLPAGTRPSRKNVLPALSNFNVDGSWHSLRRPLITPEASKHNWQLVEEIGLLSAPFVDFGRLRFQLTSIPLSRIVDSVIARWALIDASPSWRQDDIEEFLRRHPRQDESVPVILMTRESLTGLEARERSWFPDTGYVNLFQGRDNDDRVGIRYEGDRTVGLDLVKHDGVVLQVHFVKRKDISERGAFTLAINLGDRQITRRDKADES
jgi:hypothetical protein